jgi:protein-S-isoprenylcysteine O-methyltransferase Ste14
MLDAAERVVRIIGAIAGLSVLTFAVVAMLLAVRKPAAMQERAAQRMLRPSWLVLGTALFLGVGILLWSPLPVNLPPWSRATLLVAGSLLFLGGLVVYLLGMRALGELFAPSLGFGVRVQVPHHLVTEGPFSLVRHPMYLGVIIAAIGTLMLYRTWASLLFAVGMFGLLVRARREERVLAREFPEQWATYSRRVPAWRPALRRRRGGA